MTLPPEFLDQLRSRIPVSQVVGRRLKLIRAGAAFKALCPFHTEKSPSFTVDDRRGTFHCFGCGAHGGVIDFLMRHDGLAFLEAVEQLASMAGLETPKRSPQARAQAARRRTLSDALEAACRFFEAELRGPGGADARRYLAGRGLDEAAIAGFRLGYAPRDRQRVIAALAAEGVSMPLLLEAGLARQPEDGRAPYGFFRDRIIFPVEDRRGRIIGFGGRLMAGDGPKYINSPETPLFRKRELLYGAPRASRAAARGQTVLVTEGYMDVIALVRAGYEGAVAPLGTALTEAQIADLWRMSPEPVLCFDGDEAGRRAASTAIDRLLPGLGPGRTARIAFLPEGEDPDSLMASGGRAAMEGVLDRSQALADQLWERAWKSHQTATPEGRAGLKAALMEAIGQIAEPVTRGLYRQEMTARFDAAFPWRPAGRAGGGKAFRDGRRGRRPGPVPRRHPGATPFFSLLMAALVAHPVLFDEFGEILGAARIPPGPSDRLRDELMRLLGDAPGLDSAGLRLQLHRLGLADEIERLESSELILAAPFRSAEVARTRLRDMMREQFVAAKAEAALVEEALATEWQPRSVERLRILSDQAQPQALPLDDGVG